MRPPSSGARSTTVANDWKSKEGRNLMLKKIVDFIIKRAPSTWTQDSSAFINLIERFEKEVFDSAKDEGQYNARIITRLKSKLSFQSDESNILPSKVLDSERDAFTTWQEHMYEKIQAMKDKNMKRLNIVYYGVSKRLQQLNESAPDEHTTSTIEKCKYHKNTIQCIDKMFKVKKSDITPDILWKVGGTEYYLKLVGECKHFCQHSNVYEGEGIFANNSTSQVMGQQSSQLTEPVFHPVPIQFRNSHQQKNLVSDEQDDGNVVQQQTSGEITSPIIATSGISASTLLQNDNIDQVKENSQDQTIKFDDPSPEIQHLLDVLNSVPTEALVSGCGDIGMLMHLDDDMSTLEPLIGPPIGSIGSNLEGVFVTDSQAKYLSRGKFGSRERKMNHFLNSTPITDGFGQLPSLDKSFPNSNTSQGSYAFLEEIEEINRKLIDIEIVVDKEKLVPTVVEHVEGFTVRVCFNSVTVNLDPLSGYYPPPKESMIDPLWLHIPANYPQCSVIVLDDMPSHARDPDTLSMKAHVKFRLSARRLSETLSLKVIATLWDRCAREVILDYAKLQGGGTFTSKYGGGWETCLDDDS